MPIDSELSSENEQLYQILNDWAFPHNMIDVSVVLESLTEDTQNGIPSGPNPVTRGEIIFH